MMVGTKSREGVVVLLSWGLCQNLEKLEQTFMNISIDKYAFEDIVNVLIS